MLEEDPGGCGLEATTTSAFWLMLGQGLDSLDKPSLLMGLLGQGVTEPPVAEDL